MCSIVYTSILALCRKIQKGCCFMSELMEEYIYQSNCNECIGTHTDDGSDGNHSDAHDDKHYDIDYPDFDNWDGTIL